MEKSVDSALSKIMIGRFTAMKLYKTLHFGALKTFENYTNMQADVSKFLMTSLKIRKLAESSYFERYLQNLNNFWTRKDLKISKNFFQKTLAKIMLLASYISGFQNLKVKAGLTATNLIKFECPLHYKTWKSVLVNFFHSSCIKW